MNHLGGCVIEGDSWTWAPEAWALLVENLNVRSMLDVGCGAGHSLKWFLDRGIFARGIEGWQEAIEASAVREYIIQHDFTQGPFVAKREYDLVHSVEFVEHVEEQYAENFLQTFAHARHVAMTFAEPGQPGYHHVNCQPAEYWIAKMAEHDFKLDTYFSSVIRQIMKDKAHGQHIARSMLIFHRNN